MPPKGKVIFNAFAALDSEEEEDPVIFHEPPPPVRLQKKKPQKVKVSSGNSSSSSGSKSNSNSKKVEKQTCAQHAQQVISDAIPTTSINVIVLEYLNIPRGVCAYPIVFGSSGDYSSQYGASWNADITLLGEKECTYSYKSVLVATKKFQTTITTEIVRKGTYDVFPGGYFIFNWTNETHTKGEYLGHQDIVEKECNLTWRLDISVFPLPPAKPKAGIAPMYKTVYTPANSPSAPTSIWKEEPEVEKQEARRLSKHEKKRLELKMKQEAAKKQGEEAKEEEESKKQEEVGKERLLHTEIRWRFEMKCLLYDSEMIWRVMPQRIYKQTETLATMVCGCSCCDNWIADDDWLKTNPIAWQLFSQNIQDVLRCFA